MPGSTLSPVLAAGFILAWSSGYIAGPAAVSAVQPLTVLVARFGGTGLIALALVLALRRPFEISRTDLLRQAATGIVLNAVVFGAMYLAFDRGASSTIGALVHSLSPVLTALLAGALFGERLRAVQMLGFGLGVVGVIVVLGPDLDGAGSPVALALMLLSLLGLSLGTLGQRWISRPPDPLWSLLIQCAASVPPIVALAALFEWRDGFPSIEDPGIAAISVTWMIVVNSLFGLVLLGLMVRQAGAGAAASTFFLMPPITAVLAWLVFGDTMNLREVVGLLIAVFGVAAATRLRATPQPDAA